MTAVCAFDEKMLLDIVAVVGVDLSKWSTPEKFVDCPGLSPRRKKSGGKILGHEKRKMKNPATQAFRLVSRTLWNSKTPWGCLYRRLAASKAIARKLARLFYIPVTQKVAYDETVWTKKQEEQEKREIVKMEKMAKKLGFEVKKKVA